MNLYVIAQEHHDGYLVLTVGTTVLAFEDAFDAEDYADTLDESGEFVAIAYDPTMGPCMVVV